MAKKKKKREEFIPEARELSQECHEALELVEGISDTIADVPDWAKEKAEDYFNSVSEKAESIGETIQERGEVTDKQMQALKNMLAGVRKWIRE